VGYKLIADKLRERDARFGLAPKHPIVEGVRVVGIRAGKVLPGEVFEWHGDPDMPPGWASPATIDGKVDEAARKAYKRKHARHGTEAQRRLDRLKAEQTRIEREIAAEAKRAKETGDGEDDSTSSGRGSHRPPGSGPQGPRKDAADPAVPGQGPAVPGQ